MVFQPYPSQIWNMDKGKKEQVLSPKEKFAREFNHCKKTKDIIAVLERLKVFLVENDKVETLPEDVCDVEKINEYIECVKKIFDSPMHLEEEVKNLPNSLGLKIVVQTILQRLTSE